MKLGLDKYSELLEIYSLYSQDNSGIFQIQKYQEKSLVNVSIYDIPSLLKLLCLKQNITDPNTSKSKLVLSQDSICKVLSWNEDDKRAILVEKKKPSMDLSVFEDFFVNAQEDIDEFFVQRFGKGPNESFVKSRVFPRYDVDKFNIYACPSDRPKIKVSQISAGGLKIVTNTNIPLNTDLHWNIEYLKYSIPVIVTAHWSEFQGGHFIIGFKLRLESPTHIDRWIKFLKAVHMFFDKHS